MSFPLKFTSLKPEFVEKLEEYGIKTIPALRVLLEENTLHEITNDVELLEEVKQIVQTFGPSSTQTLGPSPTQTSGPSSKCSQPTAPTFPVPQCQLQPDIRSLSQLLYPQIALMLSEQANSPLDIKKASAHRWYKASRTGGPKSINHLLTAKLSEFLSSGDEIRSVSQLLMAAVSFCCHLSAHLQSGSALHVTLGLFGNIAKAVDGKGGVAAASELVRLLMSEKREQLDQVIWTENSEGYAKEIEQILEGIGANHADLIKEAKQAKSMPPPPAPTNNWNSAHPPAVNHWNSAPAGRSSRRRSRSRSRSRSRQRKHDWKPHKQSTTKKWR
jgi:hypothetical protein